MASSVELCKYIVDPTTHWRRWPSIHTHPRSPDLVLWEKRKMFLLSWSTRFTTRPTLFTTRHKIRSARRGIFMTRRVILATIAYADAPRELQKFYLRQRLNPYLDISVRIVHLSVCRSYITAFLLFAYCVLILGICRHIYLAWLHNNNK